MSKDTCKKGIVNCGVLWIFGLSFTLIFTAYGYTTYNTHNLRQEHKEDMQLLVEKIDKLYDRVGEMIIMAKVMIKIKDIKSLKVNFN